MAKFNYIAGDNTLDLLNTVGWRLSDSDREERIVSYADVLLWCEETELISAEEAKKLTSTAQAASDLAEDERLEFLALREAAYTMLIERDDSAAKAVAEQYRTAIDAASFTLSQAGWDWHDAQLTLASPRHRIARALIRLLDGSDLERLHQCEDAKCGWVYFDTSPRHNRRWCNARDCGDRNRARSYYARKKERA